MNRFFGWDKYFYGYYGDDGYFFCFLGIGQFYGFIFIIGDVIGCCVNFINGICFYIKNGYSFGIVFIDFLVNFYFIVGLQIFGEIVDVNFGQQFFLFDIEDYMWEWCVKVQGMVYCFFISVWFGEWQVVLQNMVLFYFVYYGYCVIVIVFV